MNKLVLAGVSILAISLSSAVFAANDKMDAKDAKVEVTAETHKANPDCPPKKKHKKVHHKHKHVKHHQGPLWVNAEEPCVVPAPCAPVCPPAPCAPVCEPTCPPAPCPPAPCAPVCEPTCPPAPCPPPAPVCKPTR